jgi:thymidylate kinase
MVKQESSRWVVINAGKEWQAVQKELRKVIEERL